ncbi:hypothetical protein MBM_07863 [Drepanopeziza brunnea f. sp. 'multigermtubi' MB_m1]|uniref:BZIP transcription factor n=1 Tax=Marssonina brunnea f. sp. multigermtubi (strain MB_m1) TaxID=1072389 RepID=K1WMX4_MARBU|nr:uncharacterized protein MBM_07863 [Drepanopeziza brunnea f. sp. 'multigermtubi' MB_m1]EKD13662.1 hypothetical protein MBM_07863 [Drepanopeziza brunnea f. sp. 'multigermtubi' MB_m1]
MADGQSEYPDPKEVAESRDAANEEPAPKRRAPRAGSRSVSLLTPEKLSRKRANDRESQRLIRQRTKAHIEELEERIRQLSEHEDTKELEQIKRRNADLEEELKQLQELLGRSDASGASSPEPNPLSPRFGLESLDNQTHPLAYSSSMSPQIGSASGPGGLFWSFPTSSAGDLPLSFAPGQLGLHSGFSKPRRMNPETFISEPDFQNITNAPVIASPIRGGGPISRPQVGRSRSYLDGQRDLPASKPLGIAMTGLTIGVGPPPLTGHPTSIIGNPPIITGMLNSNAPAMPSLNDHLLTTNLQNAETDSQVSAPQNRPTYELAPSTFTPVLPWRFNLVFTPPKGPLERILLSLLQRQRALVIESTPGSSPIGPYYPDLKAFTSLEMSSKTHPVASVIAQLFLRVRFRSLAEKVAAAFLVYHFCQWQILPDVNTYSSMPERFRPRPSQMSTAHPIWTTLLAWGRMRDVVISNQEKYATAEFMELYNASVNVNWPYGEENILMFVGEEVMATEAFIQHIETEANFSLDEPFQQRYPELRNACRFTELESSPQMSGMNAMADNAHDH